MVLVGAPDSTRLAECCHLQMFSPENLFKLFQHLHLYMLIVSEILYQYIIKMAANSDTFHRAKITMFMTSCNDTKELHFSFIYNAQVHNSLYSIQLAEDPTVSERNAW